MYFQQNFQLQQENMCQKLVLPQTVTLCTQQIMITPHSALVVLHSMHYINSRLTYLLTITAMSLITYAQHVHLQHC